MTETNQQTRVAPTHPHVDRTVAPGMWSSHPHSSTSKVFFTSSTLLTLPCVPFFLCPLTASWKCGKAPRHSAVVHYWRKVTSGARPVSSASVLPSQRPLPRRTWPSASHNPAPGDGAPSLCAVVGNGTASNSGAAGWPPLLGTANMQAQRQVAGLSASRN